jgi:predicted Zn-dependent protease
MARSALMSGRSVGVDKLGPSIAMLPSPDAAATAFSEVTSFVQYWISENGDAGLQLLLADLKGIGGEDPNLAMRSVSGYDLSGWILRWQHWLLASSPPTPTDAPHVALAPGARLEDVTRRVRLGDLLFGRGHSARAADQLGPASRAVPSEAALRFRASRALLDSGSAEDARAALGKTEDIRSVHGGWQALFGRFRTEAGDRTGAERAFRLGVAVDPLSEDVACEGYWSPRGRETRKSRLPDDARRRALCQAIRQRSQD